ncbi:MAG: hypothetical protein WKG06_12440 [Segetibacter sp.]
MSKATKKEESPTAQLSLDNMDLSILKIITGKCKNYGKRNFGKGAP